MGTCANILNNTTLKNSMFHDANTPIMLRECADLLDNNN